MDIGVNAALVRCMGDRQPVLVLRQVSEKAIKFLVNPNPKPKPLVAMPERNRAMRSG